MTGPVYGHEPVGPLDHDLTRQHKGEPLGERIIVHGRVLDGRPVRNSLVEIWQANAAGRYIYQGDRHPAPLDPNFSGAGRCLTDDEGRYRFVTVKPGAYYPVAPDFGPLSLDHLLEPYPYFQRRMYEGVEDEGV
jgi:protocatechuate 3,4-dioxygenase, beta subunit